MRQPYVHPLAYGPLRDLAELTATGDVDAVKRWVEQHSMKNRRRERGIVRALAYLASLALSDGKSSFYRLEVVEGAGEPDQMAGRLVAASLNEDEPTCDALITTLMDWPTPARADVLLHLIVHASKAPTS